MRTTDVVVIASGADHEKVAKANPNWDEFDWCRYWELDARKGYKRLYLNDPYAPYDPGRRMDCGDSRCKCKAMKKEKTDERC